MCDFHLSKVSSAREERKGQRQNECVKPEDSNAPHTHPRIFLESLVKEYLVLIAQMTIRFKVQTVGFCNKRNPVRKVWS